MPGYRISVSKGRSFQLPLFAGVITLSGLTVIVSILFWRLYYEGGFSWNSHPGNQFSWHPLLMSLTIILLGYGAIMYRITPCVQRKTSKALHSLVMFLSLCSAVPGIWAVWESHNLASPPIPHMFSLHSWLGLVTMIMMTIQLIIGLIIFLFPCAPSRVRGRYHHLHVFFGIFFLAIATATALIGLTEEGIFSLGNSFSELPGKGILLNLIGLFLVTFTSTVIFVATKSSFKPLD